MLSMKQIYEAVNFAYKANGIAINNVKIKVNKRKISSAGTAAYLDNTITVNVKVWQMLNDEQQRDVVIHEACHLIAAQKFGSIAWGHGRYWKHCMIKAGLSPERCIDITTLPMEMACKVYKMVYCPAHGVVYLGPRQWKSFLNGVGYRCNKCGKKLQKDA